MLSVNTRTSYARYVRRFLRWLVDNVDNVDAALNRPEEWAAATNRFLDGIRLPSGALRPSGERYRDALKDCAQRLNLAEAYIAVPKRFLCTHDICVAALSGRAGSTATRESHIDTLDAFLRWLDQTGGTIDDGEAWRESVERYLQNIMCSGKAVSTIRRRRVALNDCAKCLGFPKAGSEYPETVCGEDEVARARYDWAGRHYYLLSSPVGERVICCTEDLLIPDEDETATATLSRVIAERMFQASAETHFAFATIAGSDIIMLLDDHAAHVAERGKCGTFTLKRTFAEALRIWNDHVNDHTLKLGVSSISPKLTECPDLASNARLRNDGNE
jgi:hypothetical protein